jgi:thymidylate synthase (FAD)
MPEDPYSLGVISWKEEPGEAARSTESFIWYRAMETAEKSYLQLLKCGRKPEEARGVLPNDLKTEIVCTANIVALRHFFKLRCAKAAHPQIRFLAQALLELMMWSGLAVLFQDQIDEFLIFPKGPANE